MYGQKLQESNYLAVISAQVQCINELSSETRKDRLALTQHEANYSIEKIAPTMNKADHSITLFQGKGRACHLFLNGYLASFLAG